MTSELQYFAESYFHQDYDLDARSPIDNVRRYCEQEPKRAIKQLATEIESELSNSSEATLRRKWVDDFDSYYEPDRDGMTYREWFEKVLAVLRGSI